MSDTIIDPNGTMANEARDAGGRLLDQHGRAVGQARQTAEGMLDQVGHYVREQPISTALLALGIGYIIGRLRII